jgi:hypothetical protein
MTARLGKIRHLVAVLPVLAFLCSTPAAAQTMGFAEAADKLVAACGKDMDANCKGVNLGNGRMGACLSKNRDRISTDCQQTYAAVFAGIERRAQARVAVLKICDVDMRRLCGGTVKGDGQVLECMLTASRAVSPKCSQAITDAGYR